MKYCVFLIWLTVGRHTCAHVHTLMHTHSCLGKFLLFSFHFVQQSLSRGEEALRVFEAGVARVSGGEGSCCESRTALPPAPHPCTLPSEALSDSSPLDMGQGCSPNPRDGQRPLCPSLHFPNNICTLDLWPGSVSSWWTNGVP